MPPTTFLLIYFATLPIYFLLFVGMWKYMEGGITVINLITIVVISFIPIIREISVVLCTFAFLEALIRNTRDSDFLNRKIW